MSNLAIVTGGASGIGKATSQLLAENGVNIIIADINEEAAKNAVKELKSGDHFAVAVDVSNLECIKSCLKKVNEKYSKPANILVNCAGIAGKLADITETTEDCFDKLIAVNLKGTYFMSQQAAKEMVKGGVKNGSIINISSVLARMPTRGMSVYCLTKSGIDSVTRSLAEEFSPQGIRCNAIRPGLIRTPMLAVNDSPAVQQANAEKAKKFVESTPLKRMGEAEDIANAALFLATDKSSFATGAFFDINGGVVM